MVWNLFGGRDSGTKDTDDKDRQEGQDVPRDAGIQGGRTSVGFKEGTPCKEPEASDSDRVEGKRTVQEWSNGYEQGWRDEIAAKQKQVESEARERDPVDPPFDTPAYWAKHNAAQKAGWPAGQVEPYTVRIFLNNGLTMDNSNVTIPWLAWVQAFHANGGLLTVDGFTPGIAVATAQIVKPAGIKNAVEIHGNVIPFKGGEK